MGHSESLEAKVNHETQEEGKTYRDASQHRGLFILEH